jgi:hypothetical protein
MPLAPARPDDLTTPPTRRGISVVFVLVGIVQPAASVRGRTPDVTRRIDHDMGLD